MNSQQIFTINRFIVADIHKRVILLKVAVFNEHDILYFPDSSVSLWNYYPLQIPV